MLFDALDHTSKLRNTITIALPLFLAKLKNTSRNCSEGDGITLLVLVYLLGSSADEVC